MIILLDFNERGTTNIGITVFFEIYEISFYANNSILELKKKVVYMFPNNFHKTPKKIIIKIPKVWFSIILCLKPNRPSFTTFLNHPSGRLFFFFFLFTFSHDFLFIIKVFKKQAIN